MRTLILRAIQRNLQMHQDGICITVSICPRMVDYVYLLLELDSPAQCPLGWAQVATLQHQEGKGAGGATIRFSLGDQTTAVVCCPS